MFTKLSDVVSLAFFLVVTAASCATTTVVNGEADLKAINADVKACISQNAPAAIQLVERNAGPALYDAFMCEASDGFSTGTIPMCLEEALSAETAGLGVYAEDFKLCVVDKVENDPNIKPLAKQRAHLVKARIMAVRAARK